MATDRVLLPRPLSRRRLLGLALTAAGAPLAASRAAAQTEGLVERTIEVPIGNARASALLVHANLPGRLPVVLLVPDTGGVNPSYTRMARRLARLGYLVVAPSFVSVFGAADDRNARSRLNGLGPVQMAAFLRAAVDHVAALPNAGGSVGVVAFTWGGPGLATLATEAGPVKAMVLFYVTPPPADQIPALRVPIQLHYAGLDERTSGLIEPTERKLIGYSKVYEQFVYEGLAVSFMNEQTERRFDEVAAARAFDRMEFFLARYVRGR